MEQFLRTYYKNLNPNATEEEILAFLQSQGFGNTTVAEGITAINPMPLQTGGDDSGGINNIVRGTGFGKPPTLKQSFLVGLAAPPVGIAMGLRNLASQGKLPFGLNEVFGDEYTGSGINKEALERGIRAAEDDNGDSGFEDTTASGGPQSMGSAQGGAGGRPY